MKRSSFISVGLGFLITLTLRQIVMRFFSPTVSFLAAAFGGLIAGSGIYYRINLKSGHKLVVDKLLSCRNAYFQEIKQQLTEDDIANIEEIMGKYIDLLDESGSKIKTKPSKYQHLINYYRQPLIYAVGNTIPEKDKELVVSKFIKTLALILGHNTKKVSINTSRNTNFDGRDLDLANSKWVRYYSEPLAEVKMDVASTEEPLRPRLF
jgi:hypothetical protein